MKQYIFILLSCVLLVSCGSSVDSQSTTEPLDISQESQELNF